MKFCGLLFILECVWSGPLKRVLKLFCDGETPYECCFSSGWRSGGVWKCSVIQKSGCSAVAGWVEHAVWSWGELVLLASAAVDNLVPLMGEG